MKYLLWGVIASFLAVMGWCCIRPGDDDDGPLAPQAVRLYNWRQFGEHLRANLPAAARQTERKTVDYVVERVSQRLASLEIEPNGDADGRERSRLKYGDANIGTCAHAANALKQALLGAGVAEPLVKFLQVRKLEEKSSPTFDYLNYIHAALAYLDEQNPVVFDLWLYGQGQLTYRGFRADGPNAFPLAAWMQKMKADGYLSIHCAEHLDINGFLANLDAGQWAQRLRNAPLTANSPERARNRRDR